MVTAEQPRHPYTNEQVVTHTYGICPVNNLASLISRHLFTNQAPSKLHLDQHRSLMKPIMEELAEEVIKYD